MQDGISTLFSHGIARQSLHNHPLDAAGAAVSPTADALRDGESRKLPHFDPLTLMPPIREAPLGPNALANLKGELASSRPLLAGIFITANYGQSRLSNPGPRNGQHHAVAILGYSDIEAAFIVQDSRGAGKFLGGQWWLPYQAVVSGSPVLFRAFSIGLR